MVRKYLNNLTLGIEESTEQHLNLKSNLVKNFKTSMAENRILIQEV